MQAATKICESTHKLAYKKTCNLLLLNEFKLNCLREILEVNFRNPLANASGF